MKDDILDIIGFLAFMAFIICGAVGFVYFASMTDCHAKLEKMQTHGDYGMWQGCMVEYQPGKWIPLTALRVTESRP